MAAAPDSAECPVPVRRDSAGGWEGAAEGAGQTAEETGRGAGAGLLWRGQRWDRRWRLRQCRSPSWRVWTPLALPSSSELHTVLVALVSGFELAPNAQLFGMHIIYRVPNSSFPSIPLEAGY